MSTSSARRLLLIVGTLGFSALAAGCSVEADDVAASSEAEIVEGTTDDANPYNPVGDLPLASCTGGFARSQVNQIASSGAHWLTIEHRRYERVCAEEPSEDPEEEPKRTCGPWLLDTSEDPMYNVRRYYTSRIPLFIHPGSSSFIAHGGIGNVSVSGPLETDDGSWESETWIADVWIADELIISRYPGAADAARKVQGVATESCLRLTDGVKVVKTEERDGGVQITFERIDYWTSD